MHLQLGLRHRAWVVLDDLGREFLQDLLFGPAQYERCYSPFEALECLDECLCVFELLLHSLDVSGEVLVVQLTEGGLFF